MAKKNEKKIVTDVYFEGEERAILVMLARSAPVKGPHQIRTSTTLLDALEGGSDWDFLDVVGNIDYDQGEEAIVPLTKEMTEFLQKNVIGAISMSGKLARKIEPVIDRLDKVKDGTYELPEELKGNGSSHVEGVTDGQ